MQNRKAHVLSSNNSRREVMNNVSLVGRITKDLELKYTQSNKAVVNFTLAVNRNFQSSDGEEADFIRVQVWNKTAENLVNYMSKGSQIGVTGRIQTRSYDKDNGERVYITEVIANTIDFLETKSDKQQNNSAPQQQNYQNNQNFGGNNNYNPANNTNGQSQYQNAQNSQNFNNSYTPAGATDIDIQQDDLPF